MLLPTDRRLRRSGHLTFGAHAPRRSPCGPPVSWTLQPDDPGAGPWNMAVDMALAQTTGPDHGVLRIYSWDRPTISFGRNQRARLRYDPAAIQKAALDAVRRPTGGREVVHDREVTYACVLPARALGFRETYRSINAALTESLRSLGVPAVMSAGSAAPLPPDAGPCFGKAVAGEVEVESLKIAGSAQVRVGDNILQHGSVLLAPPRRKPEGFEAGGISLEEVLGRPVPSRRVAEAIGASMRERFEGRWERGTMHSGTLSLARELARSYALPTWTWRR